MSETKELRTYYRQLYIKIEPGQIYAFIPGTIIDIFVRKGQKVKKGDALCSLHAMKMDNEICSTIDGTIAAINIKKGQVVNKNTVLIEVSPNVPKAEASKSKTEPKTEQPKTEPKDAKKK